jgi:hypothetical protein
VRRKLQAVRRRLTEASRGTPGSPDDAREEAPLDEAAAAALTAARDASRHDDPAEPERWQEVLRASGDRAPAEAWAMLCRAQRRTGEVAAAAATAATGLERWPEDPHLALEDARTVHRLYRDSTEDERHVWKTRLIVAADRLTALRDAGKATKGAHITEAEISVTLRRWVHATDLWVAIADRYPDRRAGALLRAAEGHRRAGDLDDARRTLDAAESEIGDTPEYHAELSRLAQQTGRSLSDELTSLADLRVRLGHTGVLQTSIPEALRVRGHPQALIEQARPVVESLGRFVDAYQAAVCGAEHHALPAPTSAAPGPPVTARPCIFVSGFLYSGSGAVFDDLQRFEHVRPAFGGREVGFLKKPDNLGMLFDAAASPPHPPLVARCVLASVFGFGQTGRPLLGYFDGDEELAGLVERTTQLVSGLRRLWDGGTDGARALGAVLSDFLDGLLTDLTPPGEIAVLNNAIIGHELDRLHLFARGRAVAVVRDPRDQYVSQRLESPNAMPHREFIAMMNDRYDALTRLTRDPELGPRIEVVRFEDYVTDPRVRERTRERLFRDDDPGPITGEGFRPEVSRRNIGVHRDHPAQREIGAVEDALQARYGELPIHD